MSRAQRSSEADVRHEEPANSAGTERPRGEAPPTRGERLLAHLPVTIIGAGRVGSFTALALGMDGIRHLRIYDDDRLDPERNLAVQLYRASDIRRKRRKVDALPRILNEVCPELRIRAVPERFPEGAHGPSGPVVVLGVDTMAARRRAAEALARDASVGWLIDVRLGGSVAQVHSVRASDGLDRYAAGLYDDGQTWGATCADSPEAHVALAAASIVVASVRAFVHGDDFPGCVVVDVGARPWMGVVGRG
jgi:hypothetical protein